MFIQEFAENRFNFIGTFFVFERQIVAHFASHKHGVRADINDPGLLAQALDQGFDLGIDQGLTAAYRDHGRVAFCGGRETIRQWHHILQGRRVLPNSSTACAGEVAGVKWFKLKYRRELFRAPEFVPQDVAGDFQRKSQRKSHRKDLSAAY
jgi:hypothetical protein